MAAPPEEEMRQLRKAAEETARPAAEARRRYEEEASRKFERLLDDSLYGTAPEQAPPGADEERAAKARPSRKPKVESRRRSKRSLLHWYRDMLGFAPAEPSDLDIVALSARIDWNFAPQRLQEGDLSSVTADLAQLIHSLAREPDIVEASGRFGCEPVVLVIALLARSAARRSRAAERIARAILGDRPTDDIEAHLARHLREMAPA
jgi:hypothetical protein